MDAKVYNNKGEETSTIKLSEKVFGVKLNSDLIHQVVVSMGSNSRTPVAHTKDRSEVRGGGIKPWRQKGTGRARHGSNRSPIWIGGGVTHGPRNEKDYSKKINKKMKVAALYSVLSEKMRHGEIIFVDSLSSIEEIKTKTAKDFLTNISKVSGFEGLATKRKNCAYFATGKDNDAALKSFANFGNIELSNVSEMNPVKLLNYKYLVITDPKEALEFIENKMN